MSTDAPKLRVIAVDHFERPVAFRLPFRFGAATVTQAPQAFVRVRIALADGREGEGVAAEVMMPKWFDKSPDLTHEQNSGQLRRSLAIARGQMLAAGKATAFGLSAKVEAAHHAACAAAGLNGLIASFGLALHERAVVDALGRLLGVSVFALVQGNRLGIDAATAPDLAGFDFDGLLSRLKPASAIAVRHTVGRFDALTAADIAPGERLDDGLPETLEEVLATYGHRYFKLKVSGRPREDVERLVAIAAVLDGRAGDYRVTIDGNEQFETAAAVEELWRRIGEEARLVRLRPSILSIEQPIPRAKALDEPLGAIGISAAVKIDEADTDIGIFPRARALGYRGISSKSCKGFYRSLINRARVAKWNADEGPRRYFLSAEDLTTQAGVAVQQDLALATLIGAEHVERNGHHYVDGMAGAPAAEQDAFVAAHPDLYVRAGNGRVRLAIRHGTVALRSFAATPGLAVGVMPDFSSMSALRCPP
jgi:hypothetical protein